METDLRLAHPMPQDAGFGDRLAGPRWVLALCFATIVFDGYDLIVYGSVVPKLLAYKGEREMAERALAALAGETL